MNSTENSIAGLSDNLNQELAHWLSKVPAIVEAAVFGSRSMGNYKRSSDVDLVLWGELSHLDIVKISDLLNEESLLPYHFDIVDYRNISNKALQLHIDKWAIGIYARK